MSQPSMIARLGDNAWLITVDTDMSPETVARVRHAAQLVREQKCFGVTDIVPSYASLAVHFVDEESATVAEQKLLVVMERLGSEPMGVAARNGRLIEIPVRYDGEDIAEVAGRCALSVREVIERHSARTYLAYAIGYAPGFAYLGDLDPLLELPRRATPRVRVRPGSVAIAALQTAVYPLPGAGGWHIIGNTDLVMFDAAREAPSLIEPGDSVRFVSIVG